MSRRSLLPGFALPSLALALAATLPGGGTAAAPDAFTDIRLAGRALEKIQKDPQLEPLGLMVVVKDGVATLRGLAPSKELIQRAVQRVREVPEIREVRNECRLGAAPSPPLGVVGPTPVKPAPEAKPDQTARRDLPPKGKGQAEPVDRVKVTVLPTLQIGTPANLPAPVTQPVSRSKLPAPPVAPTTLEEYLRQAQLDERYRRLHLDLSGGVVSISGVVARWEDVHTLSRALVRVPGVERVIWLKIHADGQR
jgi:hypothetical protein